MDQIFSNDDYLNGNCVFFRGIYWLHPVNDYELPYLLYPILFGTLLVTYTFLNSSHTSSVAMVTSLDNSTLRDKVEDICYYFTLQTVLNATCTYLLAPAP